MDQVEQEIAYFVQQVEAIKGAVTGVLIGYERAVDYVLSAFLAKGHCLIEGAPGLGKTTLVKTIAKVLGLEFSRIQFTPDLMPADITGTYVLTQSGQGGMSLTFEKGPIFANLVLADEINRATPKTQSALLEAMEEHQVSVGRKTHKLPYPFMVLATQNPIEQEGTYPLPEAQLDRFMYKIIVELPKEDELIQILRGGKSGEFDITVKELDRLFKIVDAVVCPEGILKKMAKMVRLSSAEHSSIDEVRRFVRYGLSPRAAKVMLAGAKYFALKGKRAYCVEEDIARVAIAAGRHRLGLNFEADAEGVGVEQIIKLLLKGAGLI